MEQLQSQIWLISITHGNPFLSSRSLLTLHNCEIHYLSAVNYDPVKTDLIFIRVNIYPGQLIFNPFILSGSLFTLRPFPAIQQEATTHTQRGGGRGLTADFLLVLRPLFTFGPWTFSMIKPIYMITAIQVYSYFTIIKFYISFFLDQPRSLLTHDR